MLFSNKGGSVREVRGHTGHPWNDLADALAKYVLADAQNVGAIDFERCHEAVISGDIKWNWLWNQGEALKDVFPKGSVSNSWVVTPAHGRIKCGKQSHQVKDDSSAWACIDFKIATANVLALNERNDFQDIEPVSARAERLDLQWHQEGWMVVGVQETRRSKERYQTTHIHHPGVGSQNREWNTALWLRTLDSQTFAA